ncbi:Putative uncharacterized protein [Moritella viscosa]|uniref:Uncharacterized protein n=1 Tax=Moritella viscosa TaxID=80854 RepID=A0ABY1HFY2_9GAMM|nr:Putative uncharacterized protein [Moritella viscosa]SGZ17209.1 Putative uncharacterized protein [Moritella viscosa]SHO07443.1 Putative uncharacterized protein [Moritella viscosa]SHO21905.1 Putative uncharacterized protein [Moritella viscosa]SHO28177.1 Putative uncharacterized protein [Moritella viscosa]
MINQHLQHSRPVMFKFPELIVYLHLGTLVITTPINKTFNDLH